MQPEILIVAVNHRGPPGDVRPHATLNHVTPRPPLHRLTRVVYAHRHRHTADSPRSHVASDTFHTTYAEYLRGREAFDRGYGHG